MSTSAARPLVPSDIDLKRSLTRAAFAAFKAEVEPGGGRAEAVCARLYGRDLVAGAVLQRAAVTGATTGTAGWAAELVPRAVGEFITSLSRSAAAELIRRGTLIRLAGFGAVDVPVITAPMTAASWVSESGAIPLRAQAFGTVSLLPKKMAVLLVLSREMSQYSDADRIFDTLLRETAAVSLDSAYFATTAASGSAHEGLLNGLTPLAGSASMITDISKLVAAVSGVGSSGEIVLVAAPARAAFAAMSPDINVTVLPSPVVPADRLIAVDPQGLVHGHGGDPKITSSIDAVLHMSDTPTNIGVPGSPPTVAAPAVSLFQTGQTALRLILDVAFAKRRTDAVAFMNGCTW